MFRKKRSDLSDSYAEQVAHLSEECDFLKRELDYSDYKLVRVSANGLHGHAFHVLERPDSRKKLSLSFFGPCSLLPIVDYATSHDYPVQHITMVVDDERQIHFTPPLEDIDHNHSDVNVIGLPLRSVMAASASIFEGEENNEIFWPRLVDDAQRELYFKECVQYISDFVSSFSEFLGKKPTFFLSFWEPRENFLGALFPRYSLSNPQYFVQRLNMAMEECIRAYPNTFMIDVNDILNSMGRHRIQDDYVRELSHASNMFEPGFEDDQKRVQHSTPLTHIYDVDGQADVFGHCVFNAIKMRYDIINNQNPIKIIIMDLDDSLWRGVLADGDRSPFERTDYWPMGLAEALLIYKARGGLLAICSKNDPALAMQEFDRVWRGRLKLDDFVSVKINFLPKSENIQEILEEVNLLPGNALFVDDNPREIDEVKAVFPEMRFLTDEHHDWRRAIMLSPSTQVPYISSESQQRTQSLKAKITRDKSKKKTDRTSWLKSLNIKQRYALISSVNDVYFARSFELLNKTNQFNTTGRRWSHEEIEDLFSSGGYIFSVFLEDKTSDNGLIGLFLVKGDAILQVILSCRVFGLESEYASISVLVRHMLKSHPRVTASYVATGRNFYCEKYFQKAGFVTEGDHFVITHEIPHPEVVTDEGIFSR